MGICCDTNKKIVEIYNLTLNTNSQEENLINFKKNYICRVKKDDNDLGIGFFCKIILADKKE